MSTVEDFRRAVEAGDVAAVTATLAEDIRLVSPVKFHPFEGIRTVAALFAVLLRTFHDFRYVGQLAGTVEGGGGADSHARQLVSNAKKNADQIVSQAKAQADQLLAETKADAERRRAAAQREVDELTRQKDSIATHLAQVRQLLGGQLLPGMDAAMQAPAAKPAIAAEPAPAAPPTQAAPAAPASAPRNGNGGSAAPTAVQPAQPASHQATQVSPAAAAAQQRPANGGSPAAATQASAKQAANGKEDDEDWWTE